MNTCHLIPSGKPTAKRSRLLFAITALAGLLVGLAPCAAEADAYLLDWFPIVGDYIDHVPAFTNRYLSGLTCQLCADRHGNQSGAMHIDFDHLRLTDADCERRYYGRGCVANTISLWVKPEGELANKSDVNTVICPLFNRPDVASIGLAVSKTKIWLQKSNKSEDDGIEDLIEYEHGNGADWVHVVLSYEKKEKLTTSSSGSTLIEDPLLAAITYKYEYKLYVNGSLVTTKQDVSLFPTMFVLPNVHFTTGRCNFTGAVDDLQIYGGALTEKEVGNIYRTGLPWRITVELTNSGAELQDKTTYQITNNLELTGVAGSALKVATNATVILEIPTNVTLTATGSKGMAGILVPSNSTLIVTGGGKLIARGGAAGEGFAGSVGGSGTTTWVKDGAGWDDKWCDCRSGAGGDGGQGGVGAGAGIGGDGGQGGIGGAGADRVIMKDRMGDVNANGVNGSAGTAAGDGGTMGRFVAVGSVNVYAVGGAASTTARESASGGSSQTYGHTVAAYYTAAGGGGGGSGGVGFAGAGIGGGGAGAGGGGGGGSGAIHYDTSSSDASGLKTMAQGGFGGCGSVSGSQGRSFTQEYVKSGEGYKNGAGGAAGAAGAAGGEGVVCRQLTATVSGRLAADADESNLLGHFAANAVTLTLKGGYDGAEDVVTNAWLGVRYPLVTTLRHSRDGYLLLGYCDESGAMYYDGQGRPVEEHEYCAAFEGLTLTAAWKPIEHVGVFVRNDNPALNQWEECSVPGLPDAVRGWTYDEDENVLTILDGAKNYWITGTNRIGQVEIRIATNATVTLTNFVTESFAASALTVESGCEAVLRLAGLNVLSSTNVSGAAGINCATGSCLTIDAAEGARTNRAFLVAAAGEGGAGIGGNEEEGSGTITIDGATVAARGGIKGGAGIGGGGHAGTCGDVTINGGRVNAAAGGTYRDGLPIIDLDIGVDWDKLWDGELEFDVDCEINWPGKWEESDDTSTETWTRGADIGGGGSYHKDKNVPDFLKDLIGLIPKVGDTIVKVMEVVDKVTDFLNWAKTEHFGTFGRICINGGTVRAPIVGGHPTDDSGVVFDGGSVLTVVSPLEPVNGAGGAILPIAFTNAMSSPAALTIPGYGTKDLYPDQANALYLWLAAGDSRITMDGLGYVLTVNGKFDYTLTPSVQVGQNAWALAYGGTCEIYGKGAMWNTWAGNVSPIMAMGDSVTNVVFTEDVTSVGNAAFRGMNGLRDVQIGGQVATIGIGAFYACTNLTNVVCGATVGEVGALAFQECPSLETIRFLDKVDLSHIAESAFAITADISMQGDQPVIDSRPKIIMPGLVETLKGSNELDDPVKWPNVEESNTSAYHFFKVVYEEK